MKYNLIIKPEAEEDIETSHLWYELQNTGLGDRFLDCVGQAFESVGMTPLSYQVVYKDLRRVTVRRFPHSILYFVEKDVIYIVACVHQKRDPNVWMDRSRT